MIRPFQLRDLALVHRLSEQGISLHTESALTKNVYPIRGALTSLVGGDFPTYVWKADKRGETGFIQLHLEGESHHGHILYLSSSSSRDPNESKDTAEQENGRSSPPPAELETSAWLPLLDQAVIETGQRGLHGLVAEVGETGKELPLLRRAGFVVYTRQDIWILQESDLKKNGKILTPRRAVDDWDVQLLYANTVPRLVQLVEPTPPIYNGEGWVLREENELTAFVHIHDGPAATWMRLYIHPNAEAQIDDIVQSALQVNPPTPSHPIYCCVRRYQSWVQNGLERMGFCLWGSQAVMVKHTVSHLPKPAPEMATVVDGQRVTPTTPFVQHYDKPHSNGKARHKKA